MYEHLRCFLDLRERTKNLAEALDKSGVHDGLVKIEIQLRELQSAYEQEPPK